VFCVGLHSRFFSHATAKKIQKLILVPRTQQKEEEGKLAGRTKTTTRPPPKLLISTPTMGADIDPKVNSS
jgi:hypothetical protein